MTSLDLTREEGKVLDVESAEKAERQIDQYIQWRARERADADRVPKSGLPQKPAIVSAGEKSIGKPGSSMNAIWRGFTPPLARSTGQERPPLAKRGSPNAYLYFWHGGFRGRCADPA